MNAVSVSKSNNIEANQNHKQKAYNPNFGKLVFSSQMAKDYFLKQVSQVPYQKRGLVKKLTELVYAFTTHPQKATITGQTGFDLEDTAGKVILSKYLDRIKAPEPFFLIRSGPKVKKRLPKPKVDTYYVDTLIETLQSIIGKDKLKTNVKNIPSLEKLIEDCSIEEQMPLHYRLWVAGKI